MSNAKLLTEQYQIQEELVNNPVAKMVRVKDKETITIVVLGDKGSGKTLLMSIIALILNVTGFDFYTNFWMDDRITLKKDFSISNLYKNPNVNAIFLDEAHNIADQNSNRTSETQLLVALFTQSRKRGQLIMLSSLHLYKIAKDLRFLTDIIAYPTIDKKQDLLSVVYWDLRDNQKRTAYIPKVSRFYKYYNTYEIIVSDRIKNQLTSYLLTNVKLKEEINKKLQKEDRQIIEDIGENLKNVGNRNI